MPTLGTDQHFQTLRGVLEHANFTEAEMCRRYGIESLEQYEIEADRDQVIPFDTDAMGVLLRLFVDGLYVPLTVLEKHISSEALEAMVSLGLIESDPSDPGQISSTVSLYPSGGVLLISDRWNHPDRRPFRPTTDVVYPAIVSNAQRFLRYIPDSPCESFLDVCAGSGVAALKAAKSFARNAVATDIADRSVLFSEFNRRLNGLENVENVQGDLYAPVAGRQFERIVAHPPYVPVLRPKYIYHDGGDDGEQIVRRIVTEAPPYLAPGGLLYLMAMVSDRDGEPFEDRVRKWLGDASCDFDLALFPMHSLDPDDFASRAVLSNPTPLEDYKSFRSMFKQRRIRQMVYVVLVLQRRAEQRDVFTIRRQASLQSKPEWIQSAIQWETSLRRQDAIRALLKSKLRANEDTRLTVPHTLGTEGWEPSAYLLSVTKPFSMEARTEPWAPHLLAYSDGSRTVAENLELLIQQGVLPEGLPPEEFARAVAVFVSGGFLRLES
jgi:SAM-dependent methyltransferase